MSDLRKAAEQALEALEAAEESGNCRYGATKILREALAQPEQEPVAYYHPHKGFYWAKPTRISAPTAVDVKPLHLYTAPPQRKPEQEPSVEQINSAVEAWFENFKNRSYQERMQHAFKAAHGIKGDA